MYVQVGDFRVSRGLPTVPLTRISCNGPKMRVRRGPSVYKLKYTGRITVSDVYRIQIKEKNFRFLLLSRYFLYINIYIIIYYIFSI